MKKSPLTELVGWIHADYGLSEMDAYELLSKVGEIHLNEMVDPKGNLFVSGPGGLWVISPAGVHLGLLVCPELPANFAFGDADGRTLYLCARTSLYRLRLGPDGPIEAAAQR